MEKLYVIVRGDLPVGDQIAQSGHAIAQYAAALPELFASWALPQQRNIVCLSARDESEMEGLFDRLMRSGLPVVPWYEEDFERALTAFACDDRAAKWLSSLPLAGRPPKAA